MNFEQLGQTLEKFGFEKMTPPQFPRDAKQMPDFHLTGSVYDFEPAQYAVTLTPFDTQTLLDSYHELQALKAKMEKGVRVSAIKRYNEWDCLPSADSNALLILDQPEGE